MHNYCRTHTCGALAIEHIEQTVTLSGWVNRRRDHGGLIFIDLRDRFGITQIVFDPTKNIELHQKAETLRSEWVLSVKGDVRHRGEGLTNPKLATGEIEIEATELTILSKAKTPPFSVCDETVETNEEVRLRHRYLDIRRGKVSRNLLLRHQTMLSIRNFLSEKGFLEITTPVLGKSTPEGARDYLVPSRIHPSSFYALPQSPQLFKQLLMISGMDRYFQVAQCFRDEDLRADRQPEFTQIDLEMSFGTPEMLMELMEGLFAQLFKAVIGQDIDTPFRQMSYFEAIDRFGTDRPDTRFGMELFDLTDLAAQSEFSVFISQIKEGAIVKGLVVKGGATLSRRDIDLYTQFVGHLGINGLAWMKYQEGALASSIVKFFPPPIQAQIIAKSGIEEGDLLFMVADHKEQTNQALDHLRRKLATDRKLIPDDQYHFIWVTDFPLFAWNQEEKRYESLHHPFTCPHTDDLPLLESDPLKVRSYGYDIVLNGYEVGGGSQRIHQEELQAKVFNILGISHEEQKEKFGFFLEALKYGTPPHLGIALGLDRIMMILCKTESIRDVIAFPKTQRASDLMMDCPAPVSEGQLCELSLKIDERNFKQP